MRAHGLAPLAARLGAVQFRPDLAAQALRVPEIEATASRAIAALVAADIPVAPIKGFAYAATIYAHPSERPMGDVDLLVPPERFADGCRRLAAAGFAQQRARPQDHAGTFSGGAVEVDLHRSIAPQGWARVELGGVWARARPAAERHDGALRLDRVDEALFQCLVIMRGFWGRLLDYVDAARLLARVDDADGDVLLARARSWGVLRATTAALRLTARVSGAAPLAGTPPLRYPLPRLAAIATGRRPGRVGRVVHRLGLCDGPGQAARQLTYYVVRTADHVIR